MSEKATKDILGSGMGLGVDGWCPRVKSSFPSPAGAQAPRETREQRVSFTFRADLSFPSAAVSCTADVISRDIPPYTPPSLWGEGLRHARIRLVCLGVGGGGGFCCLLNFGVFCCGVFCW